MNRPYCTHVYALSVMLLIASATFSHAFLGGLLGGDDKTETESGNAEMNLGEYKGLKHAVGVVEFENEAGWRGSWSLGGNLSTMLESALYDSGRFVVVERGKLDAVINEQDLMSSGRTAQAKEVAETGKLRGARYIATGAITEVQEGSQGTDGGISFKGISIGAGGSKSHIALIVKLVDTTTGELVAKERIEGKAGGRKLRVGLHRGGFGGNLGGFNKTPLGEAAQDCVVQAAEFIAKQMEVFPLEGTVIKSSDSGKVIINRGTQYGVDVGQEFVVATEGEELIDPDTGEVLGKEEGKIIARLKVTKALEKLSYCELTEGKAPQKGDVVKAP
jgi:curli biogenesis system outer membrane secretion channel CsgG